MSEIVVCVNSASDVSVEEVCNAHITFRSVVRRVIVKRRPYYMVRPYRSVNTVLERAAYVMHFHQYQMVKYVSCKMCRGIIGYSRFGYYYLFNVAEFFHNRPLYAGGYDDTSDSDIESEDESGYSRSESSASEYEYPLASQGDSDYEPL